MDRTVGFESRPVFAASNPRDSDAGDRAVEPNRPPDTRSRQTGWADTRCSKFVVARENHNSFRSARKTLRVSNLAGYESYNRLRATWNRWPTNPRTSRRESP